MKSKNNKDESRKCDNTMKIVCLEDKIQERSLRGKGTKETISKNAAKRQRSVKSIYNTYATPIL